MPKQNTQEKAAETATDHVVSDVVHVEPKPGETIVIDNKVYAATAQVQRRRLSEIVGDFTVLEPEEAARRPRAA